MKIDIIKSPLSTETDRSFPKIGVESTPSHQITRPGSVLQTPNQDDYPSHVNPMKGAYLWCQKITQTTTIFAFQTVGTVPNSH
jgi:hypothetical protein